MTKTLSIIVAVAENNGIGLKNELLTYVSNDLKRFKRITSGHPIVMGRNTWLSLPRRPLPGRENIVITSKSGPEFDGATIVRSIEEARNACPENTESFIIGGAMIYKEFFSIVDKIYLTRLHKAFEADTFFPEIDEKDWNVLLNERIVDDEQAGIEYSFIDLERK
jgi:dihydrofolate reductase